MNFIGAIFKAFGSVASLYALICTFRVFITWVPSVNYSAFGKVLSQICDPYLNWFRKFKWTTLGRIDFSPILSIGILVLGSTVFTQIGVTGRFSIGLILAVIMRMIWSVLSSVLGFFNILVAIRLIFELLNKGSSQFFAAIDQMLAPIQYKLVKIFNKNTYVKPAISLAITLACGIIAQLVGGIFFNLITNLLMKLPL